MIRIMLAIVTLAISTIQVIPGYTFRDAHGHRVVIADTTIVTLK